MHIVAMISRQKERRPRKNGPRFPFEIAIWRVWATFLPRAQVTRCYNSSILRAINLNFFPSQHKSSTEYRVSAAFCSVKRLPQIRHFRVNFSSPPTLTRLHKNRTTHVTSACLSCTRFSSTAQRIVAVNHNRNH